MEHQKLLNSLLEESNPKSVGKKCNIANDQLNANYDAGNEIIYNAEVLKSNLCDYNDTCILVKDDITAIEAPAMQVSLKNCEQFTKY